jgi:predicted DNA-binding transcriptional regulator YafY
VTGQALASELGTSLRTLYRDIATLQGQGAPIEGEPGIGYVLRPGYLLPPLMFPPDEIEALVLGSRWVADRGDTRLAAAARNALARISAVLPDDLRRDVDDSTLLIGPGTPLPDDAVDVGGIRRAIRGERKLSITYRDANGAVSDRVIWPFALGFFDQLRMVVAWCETRQDFRHFRTDRIVALATQEARYPKRRLALLKAWRQEEGIAADRN